MQTVQPLFCRASVAALATMMSRHFLAIAKISVFVDAAIMPIANASAADEDAHRAPALHPPMAVPKLASAKPAPTTTTTTPDPKSVIPDQTSAMAMSGIT